MVLTLICTWNQSNLNTRAKGFFSPFWHNCYTVWLFMCMNCRYCKILHGFILWICKLCFCRAFKKVLYLILYHEICYITICWITRRLRFVLSHETVILFYCLWSGGEILFLNSFFHLNVLFIICLCKTLSFKNRSNDFCFSQWMFKCTFLLPHIPFLSFCHSQNILTLSSNLLCFTCVCCHCMCSNFTLKWLELCGCWRWEMARERSEWEREIEEIEERKGVETEPENAEWWHSFSSHIQLLNYKIEVFILYCTTENS